ncbi:NUCLEOLAR COMPLEX 2 AND RAD4-RELATED [Salix viminalis]|uniref:NUCLEOLAR COMPLEX 2 AND RAD4-RELATED n=1 Tax=Salix viminalis TaxID=40686 RepID=A0A6N2M9C5_SALVM|nr:NUCLEOLAR COMPLEX 2 AND RAD4-RELATED [Salix viminalis]
MEVEYPVRDLEHVHSDEEDVDEEEKGSRRKSKKSGKVVAKEHKDQLQRLKEKDPDFFKYLEEHDKELLEFDDEDFEEDGDTDVEDADMLVDEEIRDHDIAKKKEKPSDNVITTAMVESWCNSVRENGKISAVRSLLKAFRIACHYGDDGGGDASAKYTIMSSSVFNKVMLIVLTEMDGILRNVLGLPAYGGKKETVDDLLHTKKWMNYHHLAKSYLGNALYVLNQMTDTQMISFTLRRLKFSSVLLVAFPALLRKYIKVALHFWSTGEGVLPLVAFFFLRDICIRIGSDCLDDCFKGIYKAYVLNCHFVNAVKLQYIQFRANCVIELLGVDLPTAYQHAFVFIRQLAMILRDAITMKTKDSFRKVYEWKFMNCLELWTGAICTYSSEADLRPLAYPLTQIISGVARLVPTARYIPLRLRCVRMLNRIAASTGTFIPVSMLLLDMLEMKELDRPPTGGVGKAIDLRNELKVNKSTLKTRAFQEACVFSVVEELAEHLAQWSYSISFFELSFIPAGRLRSFCKTTKVERFRKQMRELIRSIEANSRFTNEKRMSVAFLPNDPAAASFLEEEKKSGVSPLSQYVTTMREIARQRIDSLTESSVLVGEHSSVFRKKMPESDEDDDDADNEKGAVVFSSSWLPGGTPEAKPSKKEKKKKKRKAEHQEELASDEDVVEDLILSSDDDGSVDDSSSDEDEIPKPPPSNPQSNKQERPTNLSKKKSLQKKSKTNSSASDSSSKGNVDNAKPSPKQHRKKQNAPAKSSKKDLPSHAKKSKKRKISK